jgi:hypothetical protein
MIVSRFVRIRERSNRISSRHAPVIRAVMRNGLCEFRHGLKALRSLFEGNMGVEERFQSPPL